MIRSSIDPLGRLFPARAAALATCLLAFTTMTITPALQACAPSGSNPPPWPARASSDGVVPGQSYDPRSVVNVHGAIVRVDDPTSDTMLQLPVVLLIQASDKRLKVRLLPRVYLDRERVVLAPGDVIDVVGTRSPGAAEETVQARELRGAQGQMLLRLQDDGDGGAHPVPLR